jgi:peptidoglycan L-alanyl-D-glutamate endopeptidase CwlK
MTPYHLGKKSLRNLRGGHPHLVACVMLAITVTEQDFSVRECVRTLKRQRKLVASGASWTLDSDHIPRLSTELGPVSHAVDLYVYDPTDDNAWRDPAKQLLVVEAMEHAAETLGVELYSGMRKWGKDAFHFGLDRRRYRRR